MLPCDLDLVSLRSSPSPKCVLLGIISPDLSRLNRDLFSATWRCHGTDVPISRTDSRGTVERYFWQRSGDHCGRRRAFQGRSPDRADFRVYSNFESLSVHVFTVRRCSVPFYQIFSWFWVARSSLVYCSISSTNPCADSRCAAGGMFKHESEFSVTAAQTFVFRLSSLSPCGLRTDII